jgi:protoporphyrin/coproporphyrin ferrochelatase
MNIAVLLLAHGTPDTPEDVPCFLHAVTGGRDVPQALIDELKHRYTLIGRSPLRELTIKQAESVERELGLSVYVGMRNWEPYIRDVVPQMIANGVERAIVICLAPQESRTSTGLYRKALLVDSDEPPLGPPGRADCARSGAGFAVDFVESWHDHPQLIRAFAERLDSGWNRACSEAGAALPVIFTAHSVPARTITEGDPYERQARETAALVAQSAGLAPDAWRFAFQSQGMSGGAWLGPTVEETITSLQQAGHKGVFVQPVGFLCDHVEVLYDIDIAFRKFAEARGMRLWRAESLNDSPLLTAALVDLVSMRTRQENQQRI